MTRARSAGWRYGMWGVGTVGALLLWGIGAQPVLAQVPTITIPQDSFVATREAIFSGLANQVGTLPNPTGGGFTYTFNPSLGVFTRSTESFGPVFANRAETTGKNKWTFNMSYSRHTFDEVDGKDLDGSGQIVPVIAVDLGNVLLFDVLNLREDVTADVFTMGAIYGITDRIDVGLVLPILKVKVREQPRELGFFFCDRGITVCSNPVVTGIDLQSNEESQTGLGDIVLRGKWNFLQDQRLGGRYGLAFALDVKLPTGDEGERGKFTDPMQFLQGVDFTLADVSGQQIGLGEPPLGTGIFRVRPQLIASGLWGIVAPHVNVGAELGKTTGITNDLVYEVGFDVTVINRVTVSADLLGRHAFDVDRTKVRNLFDRDFGEKANPDTFSLSFGVKANPIDTLLIFFNLLVAMDNTGIRDEVTPTIGVEWSF